MTKKKKTTSKSQIKQITTSAYYKNNNSFSFSLFVGEKNILKTLQVKTERNLNENVENLMVITQSLFIFNARWLFSFQQSDYLASRTV